MSVRIHSWSSQDTAAAHHFTVVLEGSIVIASLPATQIGSTRIWYADIPASVTIPGKYHAFLYRTSNGRPRGGPASFYWDGAAIVETEEIELDGAAVEAAVGTALATYGAATATNVTDAQTAITNAITALNDLSAADIATALSAYGAATGADVTATQNALAIAIGDNLTPINPLNDLSSADVTNALVALGYTGARALALDNLDVAVSTRESEANAAARDAAAVLARTDILNAINALNDLSVADIQAALTAQGYTTARAALLDNLDVAVSTVGGGSLTVADIVNGVWDEAAASHVAPGSMGELQTSGGGGGASASVIADAVWDELLSGHTTAGSAGEALAAILSTAGNHTTEMNFHNWLDTYSNKNDWMADLSVLPTALQIASTVWAHATRSLTDKTGFELSTAERMAIATAVEAAIINEGDGQQVVDAIVQAINSDLDINGLELAAIAGAVRTELAVELARLDVDVSSRESELDAAARDANNQIEHDATQATIAALNFPGLSPAAAEAAAVAALTSYNAATGADIASIATLINALNDLSTLDIVAVLDAQGLTTAAAAVLGDLQTETDAAARFATLVAEHNDTQVLIGALENLSIPQISVLLNSLGLSAATIADTILDEPIAAHSIAGSVGEAIQQAASGGFVAADIHTALDSYTNKNNWKADIATLPTAVQIATAVWASANRTLTGDLPVSGPNLTLIANAVQNAIVNEADGVQVVDTIVQAINASFDLSAAELAAIGTAVRTELATELARIDVDVSSRESTAAASARETTILNALSALNVLITNDDVVADLQTAGLLEEPVPGTFRFTAAALFNGPVGLTPIQDTKLTEIFTKFGMDPANPVTYTDTSIEYAGITLQISNPDANTTVVTRL